MRSRISPRLGTSGTTEMRLSSALVLVVVVLDDLQIDEARPSSTANAAEHDRAGDAEAELESPEVALEIAEFGVAHG